MKIYGLTGNIGTGKSTVAGILERFGAKIIDADKIARDVVKPGKPAWKQIVGHFGRNILNPDRTVNRKKLGKIVFADKNELERLNSFTHPHILEEINESISEYKEDGTEITIIEAALLNRESPLGRKLDGIIAVTAENEIKLERIIKRDQISRDEALSRLVSQVSEDEKVKDSDFVLNNSSDIKQLEKQVATLWRSLTD